MKKIKPDKMYLNGFTGEIKLGKEWTWIDLDNITELTQDVVTVYPDTVNEDTTDI